MINREFAENFAHDWIDSWNNHDLDRILSHYTDDFEMTSPVIIKITVDQSGSLKGKNNIGNYWEKALKTNPNLHFELINTLFGINSVTIYYKGHRGDSAKVFHFNSEGLVNRAFAHYSTEILPH